MALPKLLFVFGFLVIATYALTTVAELLQSQGLVSHSKAHSMKQEKVSHLRFYWHDIISGRNPTSVPITRVPTPVNYSAPGFGMVYMIDDPLTVSPDMSSKLVGRAQGLYAMASQKTVGFLIILAMNFVFTEGKYNGSTITVMGRNEIFTSVREMPVIGGSRLFRFARGYVLVKTHSSDHETGDACVQYDCYVMHY